MLITYFYSYKSCCDSCDNESYQIINGSYFSPRFNRLAHPLFDVSICEPLEIFRKSEVDKKRIMRDNKINQKKGK